MADDLILKQVVSVIDNRTTVVCLHAAGMIRPVDEPFETLAGDFDVPPFHIHCRSLVIPWMPGMVNEARKEANAELQNRPIAQRRIGPGGEIGGRIPPPSKVPDPVAPQTVEASSSELSSWISAASNDDNDFSSPDPRREELIEEHGYDAEALVELVDRWAGRAQDDRVQMLADLDGGDPLLVRAQQLIENAPDADVPLYRGLSVDPETARALGRLRPGDEIPNRPISSMSSSEDHARNFAYASGDNVSVMLVMPRGQAMPIQAISRSSWEREWLIARGLVVDSVEIINSEPDWVGKIVTTLRITVRTA